MRIYECIFDSEMSSFHASLREAQVCGREYPRGPMLAHITAHDFKPTKEGILKLLNDLAGL